MTPKEIQIYVGAQVRTFRKELGMTEQQLANRIGVTLQQVSKYERGENTMRGTRLHQVSRALGVDAADLFPPVHSNPYHAEVMEIAKTLDPKRLEQLNRRVLEFLADERSP